MSQDCTCSPSSIPATTPSLTRYGVPFPLLTLMTLFKAFPPSLLPSSPHDLYCTHDLYFYILCCSFSRCFIFRPPSLPPQVSILRSTTIILSPTTEMDVALQFRGFIHPLWGAPPPAPAPTETVSMWARIQRLHFEARVASGPNSSQLVREAFCLLDSQ